MGLMGWLRARANSAATRIADATNDGEWRQTTVPPLFGEGGSAWSPRRPRRFRTVEDLERFCVDLSGWGREVWVNTGLANREFRDDWSKAAHELAHGTLEERRRVRAVAQQHPDQGLVTVDVGRAIIEIANGAELAPGGPRLDSTLVIIQSQFPSQHLDQLTTLVDKYTVPISRRDARNRRAVIEPIDIDTAEQREHDRETSRSAAKIGGWLGLVGGVVGGALSGWLAAFLAG